MSEVKRYNPPRWLGYVLAAILLLTVIIAAVQVPLDEWTNGDMIIGVLILLLIGFLAYVSITDRVALLKMTGKYSGPTTVTFYAVIATAGAFFLGLVLGDGVWPASAILFVGGCCVLLVTGFVGIPLGVKKIRDGD